MLLCMGLSVLMSIGTMSVTKQLKKKSEILGDVENINVHINSPGGSVFAAVAIANTLKKSQG